MKSKEEEFNLWLLEVQNLNPEAVSPPLMKEHFKRFIEDYNTATLPHVKYYSLEKWEAEERAKRYNTSRDRVEEEGTTFDFAKDEEEIRKMHRQWSNVPPPTGPLYTKEQLLEVRRVTAERIQAEKLRKMGFTPKESMGVRYE
ncbi:8610_t:CDS:2 [Paraglomus occultum]|uniref:8610_t:CDS:1 n=1 Tax=Paraglomus occultum TaxID=144539 RepID=A0A9N9G3S5_9GLOM|nr:8610_t:CDS:2 [Paraglomus occultum]